jgi:MFS family permease
MRRPADAQPVSSNALISTLAFCGLVVSVMQTIIAPLLPELPRLTHSSPGAVSWLVTSTLLTGCIFTPVLGRLGDMFGKRRVLLIALGVLALGSALNGMTSNVWALIVGRSLQGAALAVIPLGISIMRDHLPTDRVTSAVALMSTTLGIGGAIGLPIAAVIVEYSDWHTMFWVSAVLGLIDMALVLRFVPESTHRAQGRVDVAGALGLAVILIALLLAVEKGNSWGWLSVPTIGCLVLSLAVALVWGAYEMRVPSPMVDLRISGRPAVLLTNLAALSIGFAFYANGLATAQLVQEPRSTGYGLGQSIVVAGLVNLPGGVLMALLSPVSARISKTRGPKVSVALAAIVIVGGYGFRIAYGTGLPAIVLGASIISIGVALAYSALPVLIMRAVPVSETGAATGLNTLMRTVGLSLSSAMVAAVLSGVTITVGGAVFPARHAYVLVWLIAGVGALISLAFTLCIPGRRADARIASETASIVSDEVAHGTMPAT